MNIENVELEATAPANAGEMVTFIGVGFRTPKEPDLGTQPDTSMRIEIDGVSGAVHTYLGAAKFLSCLCGSEPSAEHVVYR